MPVIEKKSFCRVCGSGCGIIVEIDGDQVLKVRGDKKHALTKGYTCPKGRALPGAHHQPDRLEMPMIREGGELQETAWGYLLDDLGAKLKRILEESGPRAIGMFIGGGGFLDASGLYSLRAIQEAIKTPSVYSDLSIDNLAKVVVSEMMSGLTGIMSRADMERCKMVMFVGTNPMISHGHTATLNDSSPVGALREFKKRGEVWVLDPRHSETAQQATRHLAARPGTDYGVLAYLIRELLQDGADYDFIEKHTQGVEDLRKSVACFTPEHVSALCGVSKQDLTDLLAAVRRAGKLAVETGTGITMCRAGNVISWLAWALMLVTGSLDREGGSWLSPGFLNPMDQMDLPAAPETGWLQPGPESRPELRSTAMQYPCAAMSDEIKAGNLRAMINFGGNLDACMPENDRTIAALKKLEVLATIDIRQNATTDVSTHVLPGTDQLERADLTLATDTYYPYYITQYTPAMVAPVGQRKTYWWMIGQLGKRMGVDFFPGIDVDTATEDDVLAVIAKNAPIGFNEIRSNMLTMNPPQIGWVERYVDEKIGGWRLAPSLMLEQLESLEEPAPLVLIPRRQKYHENSKMLELRDKPCIFVNPVDAKAAGLKDGATIQVRSVNGYVQGTMKVDSSLRSGAITVPHGWSGQNNVNRLTGTTDVDPVSGMVRYSGLPVTLHPV